MVKQNNKNKILKKRNSNKNKVKTRKNLKGGMRHISKKQSKKNSGSNKNKSSKRFSRIVQKMMSKGKKSKSKKKKSSNKLGSRFLFNRPYHIKTDSSPPKNPKSGINFVSLARSGLNKNKGNTEQSNSDFLAQSSQDFYAKLSNLNSYSNNNGNSPRNRNRGSPTLSFSSLPRSSGTESPLYLYNSSHSSTPTTSPAYINVEEVRPESNYLIPGLKNVNRYVYTQNQIDMNNQGIQLERAPTPPRRQRRGQSKVTGWKNPISGIRYSNV